MCLGFIYDGSLCPALFHQTQRSFSKQTLGNHPYPRFIGELLPSNGFILASLKIDLVFCSRRTCAVNECKCNHLAVNHLKCTRFIQPPRPAQHQPPPRPAFMPNTTVKVHPPEVQHPHGLFPFLHSHSSLC